MRLPIPWFMVLLASALFAGCGPSPTGEDDDDASSTPPGDDDTTAPPATDVDGDSYTVEQGDCDDNDADVYPDATEVCNDIDDNCNDAIDEEGAEGGTAWFTDADGDSYGDPTTRVVSCDAPDGTVDNGTDCNDSSAQANPGLTEVCGDGLDNDCDATANDCGLGGLVDLADAYQTFTGEVAKDQFGTSVAPAGDVNKDGHPDFLVGAYQADDHGSNAGAAYLVYGPFPGDDDTSRTVNSTVEFLGEKAADWAGFSVAGAGDVNKDGYDDVLIGAPYYDSTSDGGSELNAVGAAYLIYGPITPGTFELADADVRIAGELSSSKAGYALSSAGDMNKDGYADIVIGAPSYKANDQSDSGAAYVFYGPLEKGQFSVAEADLKFESDIAYALLGISVASGNFNNDAYDDLVIGAPYAGDEGQGAAYVFCGPIKGGTHQLADATAILIGELSTDNAGRAVASAGDVDGDGKDDILVGAKNADNGVVADSGAVYLVSGAPAGEVRLAEATAKLVGEASGDQAGRSVAGAGDVNGDGLADILVGALGDTGGRTDAGAAYLLYGPITGSLSLLQASARFKSTSPDELLGFSVSSAGDANEDGFDDLLLGVPDQTDESGSEFAGAVYLMIGGEGL